jgi:uncharacterized protein (TIGR02246 family)
MRTLAILAFCSLVSLPAGAQSAAPVSSDEAAIREVVRKYVDAREKRDPVLIAALFTEDADQVTTAGEWRRGRDNVVKGGLASSQSNPGTRDITIEAVRFLAPGVAIADGRYEIRGAPDSAPRRMWTTFVLMRDRSGSWRVAAIRNMAPTDPGR